MCEKRRGKERQSNSNSKAKQRQSRKRKWKISCFEIDFKFLFFSSFFPLLSRDEHFKVQDGCWSSGEWVWWWWWRWWRWWWWWGSTISSSSSPLDQKKEMAIFQSFDYWETRLTFGRSLNFFSGWFFFKTSSEVETTENSGLKKGRSGGCHRGWRLLMIEVRERCWLFCLFVCLFHAANYSLWSWLARELNRKKRADRCLINIAGPLLKRRNAAAKPNQIQSKRDFRSHFISAISHRWLSNLGDGRNWHEGNKQKFINEGRNEAKRHKITKGSWKTAHSAARTLKNF